MPAPAHISEDLDSGTLYDSGNEVEETSYLHSLSRRAQRDKVSLYGELELRSRLFQETHARDCQEIEELKSICCEEADRDKREFLNCPCKKRGILQP